MCILIQLFISSRDVVCISINQYICDTSNLKFYSQFRFQNHTEFEYRKIFHKNVQVNPNNTIINYSNKCNTATRSYKQILTTILVKQSEIIVDSGPVLYSVRQLITGHWFDLGQRLNYINCLIWTNTRPDRPFNPPAYHQNSKKVCSHVILVNSYDKQ